MTQPSARHRDDYRDYAVFGLRVRSNVELPELFPASGAGAPDVTIELGSIPTVTRGEDAGLNQADGALVLVIPEVGRYRIEGGNRITVESDPGVPERNVRLFLLGSAFGALLHQRGLLPLHANAIEIGGQAVAFMGPSGAGKSTLAAWFHDEGYRVLADDVCVVGFDGEQRALALPGLPRVRLWREPLEASGRNLQDYHRSYVGDENFDKYDVPLRGTWGGEHGVVLAAIYLLERAEDFGIMPVTGMEAAEAVFAHTYRGAFLTAPQNRRTHWEQSLKLVRAVPIYRCRRIWSSDRLPEQANAILGHLGTHQIGERTSSG